ncbi:MAG: ABC transporter ATP-binding protein [Armatimonadetes bacterium]|nr:ABC transporter ATP-binding protein [Armatimonadota bacterium]
MLSVRGLDVYYGGIHALRGLSLDVSEGEIVTLIGSNGAGKSTTLKTLSGLVRPSAGSITFRGAEIIAERPHRIVARGMSHVPEGRRVFANLTVAENLDLGAYQRRDRAGIREDLARTYHIFPRLEERRSQRAGTLSGGEQQMLAIGRALMSRPRLLLLDEPSLGLAPRVVSSIFTIIREINQAGTTVLLVEQNAHLALEIAHRGYVIETGEIVLTDTGPKLLGNAQVKRAYLGEAA